MVWETVEKGNYGVFLEWDEERINREKVLSAESLVPAEE